MPITFPSSPAEGDTYTLSNRTWIYNGTKWQLATTSTAINITTDVTVSASEPTSPSDGQLWMDSDDGKLYTYYNGSWNQTGGAAVGAGAGEIQYNTSGDLDASNDLKFDGTGLFTNNVYATGDIVTSYSDITLKEKVSDVIDAVERVMNIETLMYKPNSTARGLGIDHGTQIGVSAQSVEKQLPEVVTNSPIDSKYKTVRYERIVPLLIEAIKEQQREIMEIRKTLDGLQDQ